jgi:adenylyltransferase/sulfurtransferase
MTLKALNPDIDVVQHRVRLDSGNVIELFKHYDIIVDGCDNFPTRYLVNDACVMLDKPNVHGSIFQFEGQATVFKPHVGPCYRCLFPEPPPPGMAPSCQEAGVLGVLPGLVGSIQALETIKLILGAGEPLVGRLAHIDTLGMNVRILKLRRDVKCPMCGDNPTIHELVDYEEFCGLRTAGESRSADAA